MSFCKPFTTGTELMCQIKSMLTTALFLLLGVLPLQAQDTPIKSIEKSYGSKATVTINHRYGPLTILPATDGKITISGKLYGQSASPEDLETLKKHFEFELSESGNSVEVLTHFKVKNWNSNSGVIRLEFQDGTRIGKLQNVKIEATAYIPPGSKLSVSNKYDEIRIMDGTRNDLTIDLYSGRLQVGDVGGRLELSTKYSKGEIGNFGDAELDIYDSDLAFGNGQSVRLKSKYSDLEMGSFDDLDADTYDDKIEWKTIKGQLTLQDKYSEFRIGRFNSARMDIYDANIVSDGGNELLIKSKYSEFKFKEIGSLSFESSYDDKVEAERVGSFSATSKYSEFEFEKLRSKIFLNSYDDELRVGEILGPFEGIEFEGKYTDLYIELPANQPFRMEANLTYGRLNYPESRFESQIYKEKNDRLEMSGKTKGATDSSPKITIQSYDGKISIE